MMAEGQDPTDENTPSRMRRPSSAYKRPRRRSFLVVLASLGSLLVIAAASAVWLGSKASKIDAELTSVIHLIPTLKEQVAVDDANEAAATVEKLRVHTAAAKNASDDPLWTLASSLPGLGANFSAVAEVARSADDISRLGLTPLVRVYSSLHWETLVPGGSPTDLGPLEASSPSISAAAAAVRMSADRLNQIDTAGLLPQVAHPLTRARDQLHDITGALNAAADASSIAPGMLGAQTPRHYLLIIQNNAEARASGGIPGALAVLSFDEGKLTLQSQSSAGAVGVMSPIIGVDPEQQEIYSLRMGKFMQDVNLTPDFPTSATTAQAMWERKTGQRVDGVISVDPVALSYILDATGPVSITNPELVALGTGGMPTELTSKNVVKTLLSDVYAQISEPSLQDAYFAGVAQETFTALSNGQADAKGLIKALTRGTSESRVLVWSAVPAEQAILASYALGGSVAGPSVAPAQFGVYFNDGTGAKMDYHVKRTVQLIKGCSRDGYAQTIVRVVSTNTAPLDAATSLPTYVTGGGAFGVPAGSVQTNIVAYGPVQANVESATVDGQKTNFSSFEHSNRPVGTLATRLAPGESSTVDFNFVKIVQHAEPSVVVTPTVLDSKDVIRITQHASCG